MKILTISCHPDDIEIAAGGTIRKYADRGDEVTNVLNTYTDRGTTIIPAVGGYTRGEKQGVLTVTRRNVLAQTLKLIHQADPKAFTFVMDSTEVHGEGFKLD